MREHYIANSGRTQPPVAFSDDSEELNKFKWSLANISQDEVPRVPVSQDAHWFFYDYIFFIFMEVQDF